VQLANVNGRAHIKFDDTLYDVEAASAGRFGPDPQGAFAVWDHLTGWASSIDWAGNPPADGKAFDPEVLGPPAPRPSQVFAIGLNYRSHAMEANLALPSAPVVFTKFPSCLAGPCDEIPIRSDTVDWEAELVVVMGRDATEVSESNVWPHVAGVALGQDISDRTVQHQPPLPQFSMAKSFPGFGPYGPAVVSVDELADPDDIEFSCSVNGEEVQRARTSDLIFSVPEIVAYLSSIVTVRAGDVIFTGTPSGVGGARDPKWFLQAGDLLESHANGIGSLRNLCGAAQRLAMTSPIPGGLSE
jgi:2-keto-4-pentenoate hydratase/2-oxohepta-3-ene-1,7-dioic acid hydratase in catechol pathway